MYSSAQEKPLVSVTVSAYNHEKWVTKAIESIVNQTYGFENIQLIVMDDFSSDNTGQILKELSDRYGFCFEQNVENKGIAQNKNKLIGLCKGKYICGCASDDYWELNRLEKQVQFLETNSQYGMEYSLVKWVDEQNNILPTKRTKRLASGNIFINLLYGNFIPAGAVLIRREVYDKVGLYDETLIVEDHYMWLKIAYKYQIGFLDVYVAYYRKHPYNMDSKKNAYLMVENKIKIIREWIEKINPEERSKINRFWNLLFFKKLIMVPDFRAFIFLIYYFKDFFGFRKKTIFTR